MLIVETIAKIRRMYHVYGKGFKAIAQELQMSKNTVKKIIKDEKTRQTYERNVQPYRVLESYKEALTQRLEFDKKEPQRRRRTAKKLFEELQEDGYSGGYDAVNDFVKTWKIKNHLKESSAFVPLSFAPEESFQFDWGTKDALKSINAFIIHGIMCLF